VAAAWISGADVCTRLCGWGWGEGLGDVLRLGDGLGGGTSLGLGDGLGASLELGGGASLGLGDVPPPSPSLGLGGGASLGLGGGASPAGSVAVGSFVAAAGVTVARWAEAVTGRMTLHTSVRTTTRRRPARVRGVLRRFISARSSLGGTERRWMNSTARASPKRVSKAH